MIQSKNTFTPTEKAQNFDQITIPRSIMRQSFFKYHGAFALWMFLMNECNHANVFWKAREIKRGSAVVSYDYIANRLVCTKQSVVEWMNILLACDELQLNENVEKRMIITMKKFDKYVQDGNK